MYIGQALWCCCVAQFCFQTDTTQTFSRALLSTCGSKVVHRPRWFWCFCSVRSYCKILSPANMIHLIPKKSWKPATNINKDSPTNSNALSVRTWHEHGAEAFWRANPLVGTKRLCLSNQKDLLDLFESVAQCFPQETSNFDQLWQFFCDLSGLDGLWTRRAAHFIIFLGRWCFRQAL